MNVDLIIWLLAVPGGKLPREKSLRHHWHTHNRGRRQRQVAASTRQRVQRFRVAKVWNLLFTGPELDISTFFPYLGRTSRGSNRSKYAIRIYAIQVGAHEHRRQFRVPRVHRTKYHNKTNHLSVCMQDPDRARYHPLSTCARRRAVRPCRRSPRARRAPILAVRPLSPYARCVVLDST